MIEKYDLDNEYTRLDIKASITSPITSMWLKKYNTIYVYSIFSLYDDNIKNVENNASTTGRFN